MSRDKNALLGEIRTLLRALFHLMIDPYQPERHYMRGQGPKSRARAILGDDELQPVLVSTATQSAEVERLLAQARRRSLES